MFINLKREYALLISIVALILSGVYGDILAETAVGNISGLILIFAVWYNFCPLGGLHTHGPEGFLWQRRVWEGRPIIGKLP